LTVSSVTDAPVAMDDAVTDAAEDTPVTTVDLTGTTWRVTG